MKRFSFVDPWEAVKGFKSNDIVRKPDFGGFWALPYAGRVIYADQRNGTVMVQWPWGVEQESPNELVKEADPSFLPNDSLKQWYPTWEGRTSINDEFTQKLDEEFRKSIVSSEERKSLHKIISLYYYDNKRRYRATKQEKTMGKLKCPRCKEWSVKPRVYRQGKKVMQCKLCGWSISPDDIIWDNLVGPDKEEL